MERFLAVPTLALLLLIVSAGEPAPVRAQAPDGQGETGDGGWWEIGGFGGLTDDRPEFEIEGGEMRISHSPSAGARVGYVFPSGLSLQADVVYTPVDLRVRSSPSAFLEPLDAVLVSGSLGYDLEATPWLHLFGRAGPGAVRWNPSTGGETDLLVHFGGGGRLLPLPWLAVRGDMRWHYSPSALESTRRGLRPDLEATREVLWLPELTAGLSVLLGRGARTR